MWKKRPYGQLSKCAEAQALRKAWPEIGQQPTAEEMEGKILDAGGIRDITPQRDPPVPPLTASSETLQAISDLLVKLDKDWDNDFLPFCRKLLKREVYEASHLTEEEAQKTLNILQKRASGAV